VAAALPPPVADQWIGGHFEFVELAVLPAFRGRGVGSRLHDVLLEGVPAERALLSTDAHDSAAVRLYASRGWKSLGRLSDDVQVMGLKLRR
jgi:ribosomal protein S18 acetylase RimI-like enzyme